MLRGPAFAIYKPYKVMPTHIIWLIDTVEGIVTFTIILLVLTITTLVVMVYIARRKRILCFRKKLRYHKLLFTDISLNVHFPNPRRSLIIVLITNILIGFCFRINPRAVSVASNKDGEFSLAYNNRSTTTSMTTLSTRELTPVLTPQVNSLS